MPILFWEMNSGKIIGGHLFSETILYAGEIDLQELTGKPLERAYDGTTGFLWMSTPNVAKY